MDRASKKAIDRSHCVRNITWRLTDGVIGANLKLADLRRSVLLPAKIGRALFSWKLHPEKSPCIEIVPITQFEVEGEGHYGLFESEKKARNALQRLALKNGLCLTSLGVADNEALCTGCKSDIKKECFRKGDRLRELTKIITALLPDKVAQWPYKGPIGVREKRDLHIVNEWRYLGTANTEAEIDAILMTRPHEFEEQTFSFLAKTLAKIPARRIVPLPLLGLWRNN